MIPWTLLSTLWQFRTLIAAGVGLIGILGTFGVQEWRIRGLKADLAEARLALVDCTARYELAAERLIKASEEIRTLGRLNRANDDAYGRLRESHEAIVAELTKELAAVKALAPQIVTLEKVIHAKAKECPAAGGVPAATRELYRWLRDNPEPAVGGAPGAGSGGAGQDRAPERPGRPTPLQPGTRTTG